MLIVGGKEQETKSVTLRRYCTQEQVNISFDSFAGNIEKLIKSRVMDNFADIKYIQD